MIVHMLNAEVPRAEIFLAISFCTKFLFVANVSIAKHFLFW